MAVFVSLMAQEIVDPQIIAQQKEIQRLAEEAGYGDIEIDLLHRDISLLLGDLYKDDIQYDDPEQARPWDINPNPGELVIINIARGESIKGISERYLFNGNLHLTADNSGKLQKVEFRFTRTNPLGYYYKEERRDLINPSPNFNEDPEKGEIDKNEDISLKYYEMKGLEKEFKPIAEFTLKDIRYFDKKMMIIEAYKKYLHKAKKKLERTVYDRQLREKVRIRKMLSFD